MFWEEFWGEIFCEEFFERNSLFTLLKSATFFEYIWKELIFLSRFWFLSRFCLKGTGKKEGGIFNLIFKLIQRKLAHRTWKKKYFDIYWPLKLKQSLYQKSINWKTWLSIFNVHSRLHWRISVQRTKSGWKDFWHISILLRLLITSLKRLILTKSRHALSMKVIY